MLVGRFIQGIGAGAGMPVGTALIHGSSRRGWRHRAFGMFGAGTGLGTVLTLLVLPSAAKYGGYSAPCFIAARSYGVALAIAVASQRALRARPGAGGDP